MHQLPNFWYPKARFSAGDFKSPWLPGRILPIDLRSEFLTVTEAWNHRGIIPIYMENHHFLKWFFPLNMVIFHSYVNLYQRVLADYNPYISDWWFGTMEFYDFSIQLGISSSLTKSIIFQRVGIPPTIYIYTYTHIIAFKNSWLWNIVICPDQ